MLSYPVAIWSRESGIYFAEPQKCFVYVFYRKFPPFRAHRRNKDIKSEFMLT